MEFGRCSADGSDSSKRPKSRIVCENVGTPRFRLPGRGRSAGGASGDDSSLIPDQTKCMANRDRLSRLRAILYAHLTLRVTFWAAGPNVRRRWFLRPDSKNSVGDPSLGNMRRSRRSW